MELLVAISILAILTVVSIPTLRAFQAKNSQSQYVNYRKALETSGKLYNDSYSDDLFGAAEYGCEKVSLTELINKKVAKDISLKDVSCNINFKDSIVLVRKYNNEYKYSGYLYCENSKHVKQYIEDDYDSEIALCTNDKGSPDFDVVVREPKNGEGVEDERYSKNKSAFVILVDNYGFTANQKIEYAWSTAENVTGVAASAWKEYSYNNTVKRTTGSSVKLTSNALGLPGNNVTGDYYLYVKPIKVQNIIGNTTTEVKRFGKFRFDHSAPACGDIIVTPSRASGTAAQTLSFNISYKDSLEDLKEYDFQVSYDNGVHWNTVVSSDQKNLTSVANNKFSDGTIKYRLANVTDFANNKRDCTNNSTFIRDNVKPTCTLTGTTSLKYGNTGNYTLTCTDALSGISSKTLTASNFTLSKVGSISIGRPSAVTNGYKYAISVQANDSSGNATITFKKDTFADAAGNKNNDVTVSIALSKSDTATKGSCNTNLVYNGNSLTLASGGSHVTYSNNVQTNAGTYTVTATADTHYCFSGGATTQTLPCTILQPIKPAKPTIDNPTSGNWTNANFSLTLQTSTASKDLGYWYYTWDKSTFYTFKNTSDKVVSADNKFTTKAFSAEREEQVNIRVCSKYATGPTDDSNCSNYANTWIRIDKTDPEYVSKFDDYDCKYDPGRREYCKVFGIKFKDSASGLRPMGEGNSSFQYCYVSVTSACDISWYNKCSNWKKAKIDAAYNTSGAKSGTIIAKVASLCAAHVRGRYVICDRAGNCTNRITEDYYW